ncbi:MAG TPA: pseudoazurin [Roseiarcus sp.]|nr:pseudoazurin [Roseiarcus sp.]
MLKPLLIAALAAAAFSLSASAAEVQVKMLNKGAEGAFVFEPALVKIAPGDTVRFVPTDKGHNVESIPGMIPEGAAPFTGKMGEETVVVFEKTGVYGYKCKPHYPMGMVGLVVVGAPGNLDAAKSVVQPGKAKAVFSALFDKLAATAASAQ